jgi:hypothetical protein
VQEAIGVEPHEVAAIDFECVEYRARAQSHVSEIEWLHQEAGGIDRHIALRLAESQPRQERERRCTECRE